MIAPWKLDYDPLNSGVYAENDNYHGISCGEMGEPESWNVSGFIPDAVANLMHAAPDLRDAVKSLFGQLEYYVETFGWSPGAYAAMMQARAAIAKATGEQA